MWVSRKCPPIGRKTLFILFKIKYIWLFHPVNVHLKPKKCRFLQQSRQFLKKSKNFPFKIKYIWLFYPVNVHLTLQKVAKNLYKLINWNASSRKCPPILQMSTFRAFLRFFYPVNVHLRPPLLIKFTFLNIKKCACAPEYARERALLCFRTFESRI